MDTQFLKQYEQKEDLTEVWVHMQKIRKKVNNQLQ